LSRIRPKTEVNNLAYDYASLLENYIQRNIESSFVLVTTRLDWDPRRTASKGGMYKKGPGINIAMRDNYRYIYDSNPMSNPIPIKFSEHGKYNNDDIIGDFYTYDPLHKLYGTIAHEVSHAVQYFAYKHYSIKGTPHGHLFKEYYKKLRINMLNNILPSNQEQLKAIYNNAIKDYNGRIST